MTGEKILEKQVLDTWMINHKTNLKLINELEEDWLDLTTSKRGDGKIGHQLAHMYNVRYWKLENLDKSLIADLTTVKAGDEKTKELLIDLHEQSTDFLCSIFSDAARNEGQLKKGWNRGLIPLLGYFIHHEAHHRGNILLTLKLSGIKLSNDLKYGLWEWQKI
jgi:uncharacterized damage-inducible protein DinB